MAGGKCCVYLLLTFIVTAISQDRKGNYSMPTVNDTFPTLNSLEELVKRNYEITGELVSGIRELVSEMRKEFQGLRRELKLERLRRDGFEGKIEKCNGGDQNIRIANTTISTTGTSTAVPLPTTSVITSTPAAAKTSCPAGFSGFENHCYIFEMRRLHWREAKQVCKDRGAYLVSVNTQAENDYLVQQIESYQATYNFWMGMTLSGEKKVWLDGTDVNYTVWAQDQPNCMVTYGCKAYFSRYFNLQWEDATQFDKLFFICELEQTEPDEEGE